MTTKLIVISACLVLIACSATLAMQTHCPNETDANVSNMDVQTQFTHNVRHIEKSFLNSNTATTVDNLIIDELRNGNVVMIPEGNYLSSKSNIKIPFYVQSDEATVSGIYVDDQNVVYMYSSIGYTYDESVKRMQTWIDEYTSPLNTSNYRNSTDTPGESYWYTYGYQVMDFSLGGRGSYSTTYCVEKLMNHGTPGSSYYAISIEQYAITSGDYRLADLEYYVDYEQCELLSHGPATSLSSSSTTIEVSLGIGASNVIGTSVGLSRSWTYERADVVITNLSLPLEDVANIWHDVDETKTVGRSYTAKPGVMLSFENEGVLGSFEIHGVTTCKEVKNLWGLWTSYEDFIENNLNVSVVMYGNGFNLVDPFGR